MPQHRLKYTFRDWVLGVAVGILGLAMTAYVAVEQQQSLQRLERERLEQATHAFAETLTHRIDAYTEIAFGLRSLFVVNPSTSRKAFEDAVLHLDVEKRYPGIKNIAFTRYVRGADKQAFERKVRADTSLSPAGYPDFSIRPPGERPEYFVADYLWPQSGSKGVHGLDISAQPANLASMRYAMATGRPTASGPFDLIQEVQDKTGFVVRVPVFSDAIQPVFLGSVAVTLRVYDLFQALQSEGVLRGLHVALTDLGSDIPGAPQAKQTPLFAYDWPHTQAAPAFTEELAVYGRRWRLDADAAAPALSRWESHLPLLIVGVGVFMSALLGLLTGLLGQGRRRALETLSATNALLNSVLDNVPIRVFWKDRNSRYLGCNQLFAQDAGRGTAGNVVGRCDDEMGWAAQAAIYQQDDRVTMESGQSRLRYVEPQTTPDGKTIWLQTSKVPLRDTAGDVVGILGVYDDVTERLLNEQELAQHRTRLEEMVSQRTQELQAANRALYDTQQAMDSVGIGIYWVDMHSASLLDLNRFAAELLGYRVEQLRGRPITHLIPAANADRVRVLIEKVRRKSWVRGEFRAQKADGTLVPVDIVAYCQKSTDTAAEKLIAFVTDITARKAAQAELLQAKRAAESANTAKSAFLANMSHEIRTPLNAISGMAYLIRKSGLSPEQAARLSKLELASDHLLHIIDDILEIAKIEAGKFTLSRQPVAVDKLMGNVAAMLRDRAATKGLRFELEVDPMPAGLEGDYTRLQQCLLNYAGNAVKFSENGVVTLRAVLLHASDDAVELRFEVQDHGIGIAPDALRRLFNVFEQADGSVTRQYGGTGLGLAITRKLVELMGGSVGASSTPGGGSLFWFSCPLRKGELPEQAPDAAPPPQPDEVLLRAYPGRRVLLAEDDAFNQEVSTMLLNQVGIQVDVAADGLIAVECCSQRIYDLVIMDMQMPRMDGLQATTQIRRMEGYAQVPILAMTANTFVDDRERCLQAGMNDFITKPVVPQTLYETLLRWLARSSD